MEGYIHIPESEIEIPGVSAPEAETTSITIDTDIPSELVQMRTIYLQLVDLQYKVLSEDQPCMYARDHLSEVIRSMSQCISAYEEAMT